MSDGTKPRKISQFFLGGGETKITNFTGKNIHCTCRKGFSYSLIYKFALNFQKINECLRRRNEKTKWYNRSISCISLDIFISLYQSKSSAFLSDIIYSSFITCIF